MRGALRVGRRARLAALLQRDRRRHLPVAAIEFPQETGAGLSRTARRRRRGALSLLEQVCNADGDRLIFGSKPYQSRAVAACLADAWTLGLVNPETGEECFAPFRCRSWRCSRCAPGVNARDAQRVLTGLGANRPGDLLFLTLTYRQEPFRLAVIDRAISKGETLTLEDIEARARALAWMVTRDTWKRLRDRLAYLIGQGKGRARKRAPLPYVQTWEGHRSGWPHVHAVIASAQLAAAVAAHGSYQREDPRTGLMRPIWRWCKSVLEELAVASGFGPIADVQFPRSWEGVGLYLVKLAQELTGSTVKGQTPIAAPRGFRRLRSTPGLLPRTRTERSEFVGMVLQVPGHALVRALDAGCETWKAAEALALNWLESEPFGGPPPPKPSSDPPP